jgi:magnesium transporter
MILKYNYKNLTWIDLESPNHEEVKQIINDWNIHPLVAQELISPSTRSKVELHPNFIYLILHFPTFRNVDGKKVIKQQEIDFIVGKNFLITTRYHAIDPLHKFSKVFEVNSILDKSDMGEHAGYVFFYMIRSLYEHLENELESVSDTIEKIEDKIFNGKEKEMVTRLSNLSREMLGIRRAINSHREILESYESTSKEFFGESYSYHAKAILGEYHKVRVAFDSNFEFLSELRETNNSLLTTKQNEVMKTFTIMAFMTFPLTLITGIFTMHAKILPIFGDPIDFWVIVGGMVFLAFMFILIFKSKKWL